jgi:hypothetical protein
MRFRDSFSEEEAIVTIDPVAYGLSPDTQMTPVAGADPLGRDTFLTLLVAQLAHQNPLEPQADGEFLAQLAQFSSLEKLQGIENELALLRALIYGALVPPEEAPPEETPPPEEATPEEPPPAA